MNYAIAHLLILAAVAIAPLATYNIVRLVPFGPLTHHVNAQGTYDRNLWLVAASPLFKTGFEEQVLLDDAMGALRLFWTGRQATQPPSHSD